jgi:hypothetical protein
MAGPAELIKWWDALDALGVTARGGTIERGLQLARESRHPDAQWLASLLPAGDAVTAQRMAEVMLEQGGDDRLLGRSAPRRQGYATTRCGDGLCASAGANRCRLRWRRHVCMGRESKRSRRQNGHAYLAWCLQGRGCTKDMARSVKLYGQAAELGDASAQVRYAVMAFGKREEEVLLAGACGGTRQQRATVC